MDRFRDSSLSPAHEEGVTNGEAMTGGVVRYLALGSAFGFVLVKSEAVSWYRIQEMCRFKGFHMYGVFASAILTGVVSVALIKRLGLRALDSSPIVFTPKAPSPYRYLLGGVLFGCGWGLTGACP